MKNNLLIGAYALFLCKTALAQNQQLYGTWRLVSSVTTVLSTGEKYNALGKAPLGYITYGPEGRMQVIIVSDQRSRPGHAAIAAMTDQERKDLLMTLTAYAGTYIFDGKTVTHHIELSWNQVWYGSNPRCPFGWRQDHPHDQARAQPQGRANGHDEPCLGKGEIGTNAASFLHHAPLAIYRADLGLLVVSPHNLH